MSKVITAPTEFKEYSKSLFIGGGISGCPDWQTEILASLTNLPNITFINPRRKSFDINDHSIAEEQIRWEYNHLRRASEILFWFCKETLCPITLYELGAWSMTPKNIFVGVDPGYVREQDVIIQTSLIRPNIKVAKSLDELSHQIKKYYEQNH